MFNLSASGLYEEQIDVLYRCLTHFIKGDDQILTLGANAGTGKTYTSRVVIQAAADSGLSISAGAFTGRACTQLNSSGIDANTLHSILLEPVLDNDGNLRKWEDKPKDKILEYLGDGIILDEASFIPLDMYIKIMDYGVKIINSGDFMQLPSITNIDGENIEFNAMLDTTENVITLKESRRFSEMSGIGKLATHLRKENSIINVDGVNTVSKRTIFGEMYHRSNEFDIVICGYNNTRHTLNALIRNARGFYDDIPEVGERVMCLRNSVIAGSKINNGELYTIEWVNKMDEYSTFGVLSECGKYHHSVDVMNQKWVNENAPNPKRKIPFQDFGFGYATTCHKAQGSTFQKVLVVDDDVSTFVDRQKWRYTAITRAASELTVAI